MLRNVAGNTRALRERAGLSQAQLALRAGVSRQLVYLTERGLRPSLPVVEKLAAALGVEIDSLLVTPRSEADRAA